MLNKKDPATGLGFSLGLGFVAGLEFTRGLGVKNAPAWQSRAPLLALNIKKTIPIIGFIDATSAVALK